MNERQKMRRYFIECCWGMSWTKEPFTLSNIKKRVRRWESEYSSLLIAQDEMNGRLK